jgi:hypothetical protein
LIEIGSAVGAPGEEVEVEIRMRTTGVAVGGTQNDIIFDPSLANLGATSSCRINPEISDRAEGCEDDPPQGPCKSLQRSLGDCPQATGCPEGSEGLRRLRAILIALGNSNPIPDGLLYTCTFTISPDAPAGAVPLLNVNTGAGSTAGQALPTTSVDGEIVIVR